MQFRLFVWMLILLLSVGTFVSAQYYYFTGDGIDNTGFQQGCDEEYQLRFDTESSEAGAGIFHLVLDDANISYETGGTLGNVLFEADFAGFPDWAPTYPKWGINYTMLEMERYHQDGVSTVSGDKPYGVVKFVPDYSANTSYDVDFGMVYTSGTTYTTETTLSYEGADIIDPSDQETYLTGTISVTQFPCEADTTEPLITISSPSGSNYVSNVGLNINITDASGNGDVPYVRTGGNWTGDIAGNSWGVINQYGVDSGTVSLVVEGTGADTSYYTITLNNLSDFDRTASNKTWQDKDRDYNIVTGSAALFDFGIENLITITVDADDRIGNSANEIYTFNTPQPPYFSSFSPADGDVYVQLSGIVSFSVNDEWAGVNTGTVTVTLSGINNAASGYNYVYSGTDLSFTLNNGDTGLGNSGGYDIFINPVDFPVTGLIQVDVYAEDLKGNIGTTGWSFQARPSCDDMQCCSPIILQTGDVSTQFTFSQPNLYISGGLNADLVWTPGDYTGYVECNLSTGAGVDFYSGHEDGASSLIGFFEGDQIIFSGSDYDVIFTGTNGQTALLIRYGQFTFKVWPSDRSSSSNKGNTGKVLFYSTSDTGTVVHSGYLGTDTNGSGDFVYDVVSDTYYVVYKGQGHLASYISGVYITGGQEQLFDFTTGTDLYNTKQYSQSLDDGYRYQIAGDLRNSSGVYDGKINVNDITMIVTDECKFNGVDVDQYEKCNLNGDTKVNMADIGVIITNIGEIGPYLQSQEDFGGFSW